MFPLSRRDLLTRTGVGMGLVGLQTLLGDAGLAVVAGGFSYADSLGAGRMLALDLALGVGDALRSFVADGRPLLGICNGFQVLTAAGLLPGALGHNAQGRFDCRWVVLDPVPNSVSTVQYSRGRNASTSISRSTIRRKATDWTRPADLAPGNFRQSTGDKVKPTK
jgi:phosphoribosylformylglycinamidine (FGAM) synthase-like amidotransferase family enzyme